MEDRAINVCRAHSAGGGEFPTAGLLNRRGIIAVITQGSNFHAIWFYVILFLLFYIIEYTLLAWKYYIYVTLSHYYYNTVQQKLFDHVINNISITEKISRGRITDTFNEDISYLIQTINSAAIALTGIIQLLIIFLIFAFFKH